MISPSELEKELAERDAFLLKEAEERIDAALRTSYGNKSDIWVATQPAWTPRIRQELMRRYQAAGWKVHYEEGSALVFSVEDR